MLSSKARNVDLDSLQISLANGIQLERVSAYKYLGLCIDQKLTFQHHIGHLSAKLRQKVGFLYRNRSSFPLSCRRRVVEAIFLSVLDYGDVVYKHATSTALKALDTVYHSAIRFTIQADYSTHHCDLYRMVGWSSLDSRRKLHWYLFLFKAITGKLPYYLTGLLDWSLPSYATRSSEWLQFRVPRASTKMGEIAFSYAAPTSWNLIQKELKLDYLPTLSEFKMMVSSLCVTSCTCF